MRIPRQGGKFQRKMEGAVAALLTHRNVDEAAQSIGVSSKTLLRWQKEPEFQAAYREARRSAFTQSLARLQQGATAAATTLLRTMIDGNVPASVRLRAAECVMNHATRAMELEDIEARVTELERRDEIAQRTVQEESSNDDSTQETTQSPN